MSRIDSHITNILAGFMGIDILTAIVTVNHQQPSSKIDSLRTLMSLVFKDEDDFENIFTPLNEASRLFEARNTIVHCTWGTGNDGKPVAVRFTARGKLKRTRHPYDSSRIFALAREANALAVTLARMQEAFPAKPLLPSQPE